MEVEQRLTGYRERLCKGPGCRLDIYTGDGRALELCGSEALGRPVDRGMSMPMCTKTLLMTCQRARQRRNYIPVSAQSDQ